jgi:hypothetical protein
MSNTMSSWRGLGLKRLILLQVLVLMKKASKTALFGCVS